MSTPIDRRTRKRLATRQMISDIATGMFMERGFDAVTVDEIATAADVSRMTVFNHFPRKEDLLFDRDEEMRGMLLAAVEQRGPGVSPIEAMRLLAHEKLAQDRQFQYFSEGSQSFVETVSGSETLKARARAIRDEVASELAISLRAAIGADDSDPCAALAATLVLAVCSTAFLEAHRAFEQDQDKAACRVLFLALIDRGMAGVVTALGGTKYV